MTCYNYWVFYILPKYYEEFSEELPIIVNTDTYIYAYTDNKDYADNFEETHDMRCFQKKKLSLTQGQIHELTLSERNKYLKLQSYATKFKEGATSVDLAVTLEERYAVEEIIRETIMSCSLKLPLENPCLLSGAVLNALDILRYNKFWEYQSGELVGSPFDSMTFQVTIDELSIYTKLFGVLLKGG